MLRGVSTRLHVKQKFVYGFGFRKTKSEQQLPDDQ